jgi:hypothetical protein
MALSADSGEKHEPVGDIDTAEVDSLKALDPNRPIREADIGHSRWQVGLCHSRHFAPRLEAPLLDHLVGALLEVHGHVEAERLGGLHVYHQFELDRGLHRKLARLRALVDAIGLGRRAPKIIDQIISIGQQAAAIHKRPKRINGGETVASRERGDLRAMGDRE